MRPKKICRTLFFASFKTEIHSTLHVTASNIFQVVWNACRVDGDDERPSATVPWPGQCYAKGTEKAWPRV